MPAQRPPLAPFRAERILLPFLTIIIVAVLVGFVLGLMASLSQPAEVPVTHTHSAPDSPLGGTSARQPGALPAPSAGVRALLESGAGPEPCWPNQVLPIC